MKEIKLKKCENLSVNTQSNYRLFEVDNGKETEIMLVFINYDFGNNCEYGNVIAWVDIKCKDENVFDNAFNNRLKIKSEILNVIKISLVNLNIDCSGKIVHAMLSYSNDNGKHKYEYNYFIEPIIS